MTTATRYKVIDTALCIGESVFEGEVVVVLADEYDHDTHELREDRDSQQRACIHWIRKSEELRAQVEAMRLALVGLKSDFWLSCEDLPDEFSARASVIHAMAALQAKP